MNLTAEDDDDLPPPARPDPSVKPRTKRAEKLARTRGVHPDKPPTTVHRVRNTPLPINGRAVPHYGRTHGFHPDMLMPIRLMLAGGATDNEIAQALGVTPSMLYGWKQRNAELDAMMRDSKEGYDIRIERSLAREAVGYTIRSEKIFMSEGVVHRVQYDEYVRPSVPAMIFWLKNRKRDDWQDRRIIDGLPAPDNPQDGEQPPDDQRLAMALLNVLQQAMQTTGHQHPVIDLPSIGMDHVQDTESAPDGPDRPDGARDTGRAGSAVEARYRRQAGARLDDAERRREGADQAASGAAGSADQKHVEAPGREQPADRTAADVRAHRARQRRRRAFDARYGDVDGLDDLD